MPGPATSEEELALSAKNCLQSDFELGKSEFSFAPWQLKMRKFDFSNNSPKLDTLFLGAKGT